MQQPRNNCLPTRKDLLAAKRLAESNATTNHFLGATQRPWMAATPPVPSLSVNRNVPSSPLTGDARGTLNVSSTSISGNLGHDDLSEHQDRSTERPSSAQDNGISANAEQLPTNYGGSYAARERSPGVALSELDMQRRSTSKQTRRPRLASLRPSSEAVRIAGAPTSSQQSALQQSHKITVSAMQRLNEFQSSIGTLSQMEWRRFSMLREACSQNDCFYLCLHQIFCVASRNPQRAIETGFGEDQDAGLKLLTLVLLPNQNLSAEVLQFFADFPAPLGALISEPVLYRDVVRQVGAFLRHFAASWDLLREKCYARKFPPFVAELVDCFEVQSPVLQRVLFNSIHRQLSGTDEATWSNQGPMLFDANQAQYQAWEKKYRNGDGRLKAAILAEQEVLGEQYKVFRREATNPTRPVVSADVVTAGQPSPQAQVLSRNQNLSRSFPSQCASASSSYDLGIPQSYGHPQWSPAESPVSRSQSISTVRVRGEFPNNSAAEPFLESRAWQHATPREFPNFGEHSLPGSTNNSSAPDSYHVRQQPPPYLRQGPPPSPNRPGLSQAYTSLGQGGGRELGSGRGGNTSWFPPAFQSAMKLALLIPPSGFVPIQTSNPDPARLALHQAYLRSPTVEKLNAVGGSASEIKLYQYIRAFALEPKFLDHETSLSSLSFSTSAAEISRKAVDVVSPRGESRRLVSDGSILYRLRSVEVGDDFKAIEEADWSVEDTKWPPSCFLRVNQFNVELRRKLHHGRDLPVDLTPHIQEGTNCITIAILPTREGKAPKHYALAVEIVEVGNQNRVHSALTMLSVNESLRSITEGVANSSNATTDDDDEVRIIDSQISVDLIDPFMATIFNVPARGKACTHRECFDLQTFFQTRKSRAIDGLTSPDEWRCPICKKDARPQSLIVDCFLKTVRDSLVASNTTANARAILICSDGSWTVKGEGGNNVITRENPKETVVASPAASGGAVTSKIARSESVVIDIDDT